MKMLLMCLGLGAGLSACGNSTPSNSNKEIRTVTIEKLPRVQCATKEVIEYHYQGVKEDILYDITLWGDHFQVALLKETCDPGGCSLGGPQLNGVYAKIAKGYKFPNFGILYEEDDQVPTYFCELNKEHITLTRALVQRAMTNQEYLYFCN